MYAIIKWLSDDEVFSENNANGTLHLFDTLAEADEWADRPQNKNIDMRVISIEGVQE